MSSMIGEISPTSLEATLEELRRRVGENPDVPELLTQHATAALLAGQMLDAIRSLQHLASLVPGDEDCQADLGEAWLAAGFANEAREKAQEMLRVAPEGIRGLLLARRCERHGGAQADVSEQSGYSTGPLPDEQLLSRERERVEERLRVLDVELREVSELSLASDAEPVLEFRKLRLQDRRRLLECDLSGITAWEERHREIAERLRREAQEAEEAERLRLETEEAERVRREAEEEARVRREAEEAERLRLEAEEAERLARVQLRQQVYARLAGELAAPLGVLMKTKGVVAVLVVARDGSVVSEAGDQDADSEASARFVVEAVATLNAPGPELGKWQSWVLEFARGILVLTRLTSDYFLLVWQAGANFGVLTWTIDKNRAQLEAIVAQAPPVPTDVADT